MDKHPTYLYYEPGNPVVKLLYWCGFPSQRNGGGLEQKIGLCLYMHNNRRWRVPVTRKRCLYGFIHELYLFTWWTFYFNWTYSRSYHRHLLLQVAFPPVSFNKSRTLDDFRISVQYNGITNTTGIKITNNFVKGILARKKLLHVA